MSRYSEEQSQSLETKPISRLLWEFAAPSIVAMSANSIYNICDSIFIGQTCGHLAIAGMTITFPMMNILSAFCIIASVGGAALTSIYMGRKDQRSVHHIFGNVLAMNIGFALLLTTVGLVWLDQILTLLGASTETLPYARQYMSIILMGVIITHLMQSLLGQIRATGFPRAAMRAQLLAVALNIVLDVLFIVVFDWGIAGAAWATIISQATALACVVPRFFDANSYVRFTADVLVVRWRYIREIMSIGIAPFLSNISGFLIVTVINLMLVRHGGDIYVSAHGICNRITQLMIMMVAGFSQGMQPIVGYNLGAHRLDRVKQTLRTALITVTVITTVGYAIIALFPDTLARLFTGEQMLIDACVPALRISLLLFPVIGSQLIAVAFFQSVHKAKYSLLITLSRQLLFLLPLLLWLPVQIGVEGVWWSMSLADCYSVLLAWFLLWRTIKKNLLADSITRKY